MSELELLSTELLLSSLISFISILLTLGFVKIFNDFLEDNDIGIITPVDCELTYVNHITLEHGWKSVSDLGTFIPELDWQSSLHHFLPDPNQVAWGGTFALPDEQGRLNVKLEETVRKVDNTPMLVLQLSARGIYL